MKKSSELSNGQKILFALGFLIMFGAKFLPAPWGLSVDGFQVLAVVIGGLMMLLVTVGLSSVMIFIALATVPAIGISKLCSSSFGNSTFMLMLFIFMFSAVLDKRGIAKRIAVGLMTSKIGRKGPWYTIIMIFIGAFIVGSFLGSTLSLMIFLPILVQIFKEVGIGGTDESNGLTSLIVCGVCICVCIAQCGTPIGHTVTIYGMRAFQQYTGEALDFGTFEIVCLPIAFLVTVAWCLIARFIWKPDVSQLEGLDYDGLKAQLGRMNRGDIVTCVIYILVIVAWILPGVTRYASPALYQNVFSKVDDCYPALFGVAALCLLRVDGERLVSYDDLLKSAPLKTLIYMAAVLGLSAAVNNADVGLNTWLAEVLGAAFSGMSVTVFVIMILTVCILATNFIPNIVIIALGMAVAMPLLNGIYAGQFNPMVLASLIAAAGSYAYAAPSSCPTAAVTCGSGWIKTGDLLKYGLISAVSAIFFSCLIGIPMGLAL